MNSKYGICEWYLSINGPGAVMMAGKMGFDGIQIGDLGGIKKNFPLLEKEIQEQYCEARNKYNVEIQGLHTFTLARDGGIQYPINSTEGELAILSYKKALQACVEMSIPTIMVATFGASNFKNDYQMKNTGEMLKLFCRIAQEEGIQLTYEPFAPIEKTMWLMEYTGGGIKLCYDILNPILFGTGNPIDEIKRIGVQLIDHIHVKDAPADMNGSCLLGTGNGLFYETLKLLKSHNYQGWCMLENHYYEPPLCHQGYGCDLARKDLKVAKMVLESSQQASENTKTGG